MRPLISCSPHSFFKLYGHEPSHRIVAPGRINLIGEHVDYNGGFVLPAAIDKKMTFYLRANGLPYCRVFASDLQEEVQFDLAQTPEWKAAWTSYFSGSWWSLQQQHHMSCGVDCLFGGEIPIGAGLSSSSAIECGFLEGLNAVFQLSMSTWDIIGVSQYSNHHILGIPGGFMDQYIIMEGRKGHACLLDCARKQARPIALPNNKYEFVLIDTKVAHDHMTSDYADRVTLSQSALSKINNASPDIQTLRDLDAPTLARYQSVLNDVEYDFTQFFIEENGRVLEMVDAIAHSNYLQMGQILYKSHVGLRDQYRVSCRELDFLVKKTKDLKEVAGARMMGGGFGGCTLNLVESQGIHRVVDSISENYKNVFGILPEIHRVKTADGVSVQYLDNSSVF